MSVSIFGDGRIEGIPLNKKIATFTSSGTWTVPAGVTYAIAHMRGGGGGSGQDSTGSDGGASSVAFASGTVSGNGSAKIVAGPDVTWAQAGANGIGQSATAGLVNSYGAGGGYSTGFVVAGADVTPAASITVTVGAGGTAGTNGAAGGSGYVYIEYYD